MRVRHKCLVLALCLPSQTVTAQTIEPAVAHRVVDSIAALVARYYVVPDTGRMIADHLQAQRSAGAYGGPLTGAQLADRLTKDLKHVNGDLHLYVNQTGSAPAAAGAAGPVMRRPGAGVPPEQLLAARRANYEIQRAERLPGNVGYLSVGLLSTGGIPEAYGVIDAAMALLARTDAMIIDLRRTRGGEPPVSDYVAGYFFGPDSVRTLDSTNPATGQLMPRWTRKVNGTPRPDVPVILLVGGGTASGAEDLAFIFKQAGRGTLVGERTAGAGRPTRMFPAGDGFVVSISGGRTVDPRTGKEWERVGIEPDVAAPANDALTVAHLRALDEIARRTNDSTWRRSVGWARDAVAARAKPVTVPPAALSRYVGAYDERRIELRDGQLYYRRDAARPAEALTPLGQDAFALGEATRVEFVRSGGQISALRVLNAGVPDVVVPRTRAAP